MGKKSSILDIQKPQGEALNSGDKDFCVQNCQKQIEDIFSFDDSELNISTMYKDLVDNPTYTTSGWDRLTVKKYKKLEKIKADCRAWVDSHDGEKWESVSEIEDSLIESVVQERSNLLNIMGHEEWDADTILFYSKLAEKGILHDFVEVFDKFSQSKCFLDNIPFIEEIDFPKIKKMKNYLKSKSNNLVLDDNAILQLNSLESIEYVGNLLLKGVEDGGENFVILNVNKLGTDRIRAERQGENEFIVNAHMPGNSNLAALAFRLILQSLPEGAKFVEKESLSGDSFPFVIKLFKIQEKLKLKVLFQNKIYLNSQGTDSDLSKLISQKNIGEKDGLFEARVRDDAEVVAHEINKMIDKYIGDKNIKAEVKEIEKEGGEIRWGVELPGFFIEKY